jgi:iron complex outermembrane receptor protein
MARALLSLLLLLALATAASAQTPRSPKLEELKQLSIEELADTDVTTASRRTERLGDVAAAVSVISGEDLRRMGVTTIPQALRLAGHLDVVQISGPQHAISARGFTISTANKMLVQIDGRTVYSPVFGGVFWETVDLMISDIERIEVTRGPGGSIWGANAINGVISIITKSAADTRGTLVNVMAGTSTLGPYEVRHGGRAGDNGSYRVYAKARFEDARQLESGASAEDDFDFGQAGFRIDLNPSSTSAASLQGDLFTGTTGLVGGAEADISGGNVLGRYIRRSADRTSTLQIYYDHAYRRVPNQYRGVLDTFDVDAQHQWRLGRQNLVVGAGYRVFDGDDFGDGPGFSFEPRERRSHRVNVFAQDEIGLTSNLFLTVGTKVERNGFTGWEVQPTVRARWSGERQSVWAAVSRAVRVPTRFDTDLRIRAPGGSVIFLTGSEQFQSETVVAYEGGYRRQFKERASIDIAAYVNSYDQLRTQEFAPGRPVTLANMMNGVGRGIESTASLQVTRRWQLHASHAYLWKELTFDAGSTDPTGGVSEANDPRHIFKIRSYLIATSRLELDAFLRHYASRPQPRVDPYTELDARLGFRLRPGWDLSLIGSSLLHDAHLEFRAGTAPQMFERALTLRSVWRF